MKSSKDTLVTDAIKAFGGFPKMVAALPIFAEVAIPRQRGRSSRLFLSFLTNSDSSKGVMIRHAASFVMKARQHSREETNFPENGLKRLIVSNDPQ